MPSHRILVAASLLILFTPTLGVAQNKCASAKIKAAVKKFTCNAALEAKHETTGKPIDATKVAKCTSSFAKTFAKIEAKAKGGCLTPGDAAAVEATVDAFVADLADDFAPCANTCPNGQTLGSNCICICPNECSFWGEQNPDCSCTCLNACENGGTQNPDCSCDCPNACPGTAIQDELCGCTCPNECNGAPQNPDCSCACPNTCLNGGTRNPDCSCNCLDGYNSVNGGCFRVADDAGAGACAGPSCGHYSSWVWGSQDGLCVIADFDSAPVCGDNSSCPLGSACSVFDSACVTQCTLP